MQRSKCIEAIYPELHDKLVVTNMGACAQELYDLGHRDNFFYLQHAMGLASSIGLGLAQSLPQVKVVVLDGDGSVQHGKIQPGAWLLMRTDWSKRQGRDAFLNIREDGSHTPGFSPDCVRFLAFEREVLGVGVECVGTDAGLAASFDPPFPAHNIMQGSGRFGLASLANLDQLPPTGAIVIAAPLKIVDGSGSPMRVLALVG